MDMSKLLNKVEQRVAEATCNVVKTKTSSTLPPTDNASCSPSTVEPPTPSGFLAPKYAPPTFHFKLNPTLTKTSSFSAAAFADAIAQPPSETLPVSRDASDSEDEFDEDNPEWAKWNCNQIRNKIRKFLGTKEMTQTAFLKKCDINSNSYYRFMNLHGPYAGNGNQTYEFAAIFFYRREQKEKEEKAKLKAMKPNDRKHKADEQKQVKAKKSKDGAELLKRIMEVELPDMDDDGTVSVFDDCDEIRKKINFFLGEDLVTKAVFLRALGDVNSNSLRSFMSLKRGANSGAGNVVYRTAYAFFEKKRILEGKEKSVKRLANEDLQGADGFPLDNSPNWHFIEKVLNRH